MVYKINRSFLLHIGMSHISVCTKIIVFTVPLQWGCSNGLLLSAISLSFSVSPTHHNLIAMWYIGLGIDSTLPGPALNYNASPLVNTETGNPHEKIYRELFH